VRHVRATLRRALAVAQRDGLVMRNAAALAEPPKIEGHQVAALTPEAAAALLAAVEGHRLGPLIAVAMATGARQGELLGLPRSEVDLDGGSLTIRQALQRVGGKLHVGPPKSKTSRRTIPLPAVAVSALRRQRAQQGRERLAAGDRWQDSGLVFTSTIGSPLDGCNVTHTFQRLLKDAELPAMRFHDLRHGAASLLLARGVPLRTVMEQLGHSTITLTANTYSHVVPELLRDAADRMDEALGTAFGAELG
jgi:integrase